MAIISKCIEHCVNKFNRKRFKGRDFMTSYSRDENLDLKDKFFKCPLIFVHGKIQHLFVL